MDSRNASVYSDSCIRIYQTPNDSQIDHVPPGKYGIRHTTPTVILPQDTQEVDPLADTIPPRYAYESDDEDELEDLDVKLGSGSSDTRSADIDVRIIIGQNVDIGEGRPLIVASGDVGVVWARGARLGEQVGQVFVNKRAVRLNAPL